MTAPSQLYQEVILEHNKKPRNYGLLAEPNRRAEGRNPLCGDIISLTLNVADDRIDQIGFEGHSCAICKASSSMMTSTVKGKTVAEAEELVTQFREMATGKLDPESPESRLGRLRVFSGVAGLPSRVKCAVLPWHTLHAAIHNEEAVSTEGSADPAVPSKE